MAGPHEATLEQFLVVPRAPGPLIHAAKRVTTRDEVDELVEELFGPEDDAAPGHLDVALVVGGLALIAARAFWLQSNLALAAGVGMLALGLILPLRAVWRAVRARHARRRRQVLFGRGLPLNVGHHLTRSLADSYERLLAEADLPDTIVKAEAATAAHAAVVEVAMLLGADAPSRAPEEEYVRKRLEAIDRLAAALRAAREGHAQRVGALEAADVQLERTARAQAGDELEALGIGALNDLETLRRAIRASERDHGT